MSVASPLPPRARNTAPGEIAPFQDVAAILAGSAGALALVFFRLGAKSSWLDEGFSIALARLTWSGMWRVISLSEPWVPEAFASRYELVSASDFYGLRVFLFARRPAVVGRASGGVQRPPPSVARPSPVPRMPRG